MHGGPPHESATTRGPRNDRGGSRVSPWRGAFLLGRAQSLREAFGPCARLGSPPLAALAGFGRHGILHEEHFFELAADMTIEVEFVVTDEEAERLLTLLRNERISIFYARVPAEFGAIEGDR